MPAGVSAKLNVLPQSPLDATPECLAAAQQSKPKPSAHWIPSRYNIRALTEDGRLILWNTYRGSMSVFPADQADHIRELLKKGGIQGEAEGILDYLVQKGFMISADANEYRQVQTAIHRQQFRTDRQELILLASEDCNFRCRYCYEDFARGTMLPAVRSGIKKFTQKSIKRLTSFHISWFGGEPLYGFPAIADLAPFFVEECEKHEVFLSSHMTTNGYLLTPEVATSLLSWRINEFQITMDGLQEDHDCNRPTRDGEGTFQTIFDNLVSLSQRDDSFSVSIRVNYDQANASRLDKFVLLIENHFANDERFRLDLHPIGQWGGANDESLQVCGKEDSRKLQERLRAEAHQRGIHIGTLREANRLGGDVCYAARPYNLLIGATGKIMKCTVTLDTQEENVVGLLHEDGTVEINDDRMALWTEPAFETDTQCQKCVVLPTCQGTHCPLIRMQTGNSPCSSLRLGAKHQLLEALQFRSHKLRKKTVPS